MGYDIWRDDSDTIGANTTEERRAALATVAQHAEIASFGELVAMLGLAR